VDLIIFTIVGIIVGIAGPFLMAGLEFRQQLPALPSEAGDYPESSNLYLKHESYNRYENQDYKEM